MATKKPQLYLSTDPEAGKLLSEDPLALLVGMVLDQQVPLEKAFRGPYDLRERLGGELDAGRIADMSPDALSAAFAERPALHRFPASMAKRVHEMCQAIVDQYGGDAQAVWTGARDGDDLLARVRALPGFGEQKAKIFVALLGKQLGVRPPGWQAAAGGYGADGSFKSVADIDSAASLAKVREYKKAAKAQAKSAASR
jgi:uncharacterized HhH-GPD family protein